MKRSHQYCILCFCIFNFIATSSNAALFDRGGGLIYDSVQDLTWTKDAGMSGSVSVEEAVTWVENLMLGGVKGWRLPTTSQFDDPTCSRDIRSEGDYMLFYEQRAGCTGGEMELLTYLHDPWNNPIFENVNATRYWTTTPYRDWIDPCIYWPDYDVPCNLENDTGIRTDFYWQWGFRGFKDTGGEYDNVPYKAALRWTNPRYAWAVHDGDVFNCGFEVNLAANTWTMFGVPCAPDAPATIESVFGDDLDISFYDVNWVVYEFDKVANSYTKLSTFSPLSQNRGYWILSLDAVNLDAEGDDTETVVSINECAVPEGCYEIPLTPPAGNETEQYNLVGHAFPNTVPWKDARIRAGGNVYTPSAADLAGVMDKTIWLYNGNGYNEYDDITPGKEGQLAAFDGFWVRTLVDAPADTTLLLPKVPVTP